jgi:hypothetical protein
VISPDTLIRRIPVTEQLICIEPSNQAIPKIGVVNQWIKVRDASKKDGVVAAWYVRYASGASAQTAAAAAPSSNGAVKVQSTAEGLAFRRQPVVSSSSLIRFVPIYTEFTIAEPNGAAKVGSNNQWLKVRDSSGTEGYVAAWFVAL